MTDAHTRILVLGSLPGEISLARGQYYANPQNQFWRLMAEVTGRPLPAMAYEQRLEALLEAGVGLWDVIATAERAGSLDGAIRAHQPNALAAAAAGLPRLEAIAFNGGKAAAIGRKALAGCKVWTLVDLPSSSPAYTRPFAEKLEAWKALAAFLQA